MTLSNLKVFLLGVLVALVGFMVWSYAPVSRHKDTNVHLQEPSSPSQSTPQINTTSDLVVTPKSSSSDPDLVVSNKYVAKVNGEYLEVPLVTTKDDTKATVTTTIDVTPIVHQMTPRWEAGIGVSYIDNKAMPAVSVQRNYTHDKAVEMVINVDTDGDIKGGTVLHKWSF